MKKKKSFIVLAIGVAIIKLSSVSLTQLQINAGVAVQLQTLLVFAVMTEPYHYLNQGSLA